MRGSRWDEKLNRWILDMQACLYGEDLKNFNRDLFGFCSDHKNRQEDESFSANLRVHLSDYEVKAVRNMPNNKF